MEGWVGKAIPVYPELKGIDAVRKVISDAGQIPSSNDVWDLMDQIYYLKLKEEYEFVNDQLYILDAKRFEDGIIDGTLNDDGSIDFIIHWYNGGAGRNEVLEDAIILALEKTTMVMDAAGRCHETK